MPCATSKAAILLASILTVGCAHTQLRTDYVKQAKDLTDIYEKQVLQNLAMFVTNPNSLPFFAAPKDGASNVVDKGTLGIGGEPNNSFFNAIDLDASRQIQISWGLTPVTSPSKLKRMRCAYQRAVGYFVDDPCIKCCDLEKAFLGKLDREVLVIDHEGKPVQKQDEEFLPDDPGNPNLFIVDPITNEPYLTEKGDGHSGFHAPKNLQFSDNCKTYLLRKASTGGKEYKFRRIGKAIAVNQGTYDCDGPCAVKPNWLCVGCKKDLPKSCERYGHYRGTYVWVTPHNLDHLTRLVLTILDYAVNEPPAARTRTVTAYLKADGSNATKETAERVVQATIPLRADMETVRTFSERQQAIFEARRRINQQMALETDDAKGEIESLKIQIERLRSASEQQPQIEFLPPQPSLSPRGIFDVQRALESQTPIQSP